MALFVHRQAVGQAAGQGGEHALGLDLRTAHGKTQDVRRRSRHVRAAAVGDIQCAPVGRERQAIGLDHRGHHGLRLVRSGTQAEDPAAFLLARRAVAFVVGQDAVVGVGEPDAAVRVDGHVVGRVQALAVEVAGQHADLAVQAPRDQAAAAVFAGDDAAPAVARPAVLIAAAAEHGDAHSGHPSQHLIVRDVGEQQLFGVGQPQRAFQPPTALIQALDLGVRQHQAAKARVEDVIERRHRLKPNPAATRTACRASGRAPGRCRRAPPPNEGRED